eukprot:966919-Amorphochlora_amoeboformis.AAC.1
MERRAITRPAASAAAVGAWGNGERMISGVTGLCVTERARARGRRRKEVTLDSKGGLGGRRGGFEMDFGGGDRGGGVQEELRKEERERAEAGENNAMEDGRGVDGEEDREAHPDQVVDEVHDDSEGV